MAPRAHPLERRAAAQQEAGNGAAAQELPEVVVKIDNEHDPFATIVTVEFGDRLGELLDTVSGRAGGRRRGRRVAAALAARGGDV